MNNLQRKQLNAHRDYAEIQRIMTNAANNYEAFNRLMDRCESETGGSKTRFLEAAYSLPRDANGRFL